MAFYRVLDLCIVLYKFWALCILVYDSDRTKVRISMPVNFKKWSFFILKTRLRLIYEHIGGDLGYHT